MDKIELEKRFVFNNDMIQKVTLQSPTTKIVDSENGSAIMFETMYIDLSKEYIQKASQNFDEYLLKRLFNKYKDMGFTAVVMLDEEQFKEFLLKYLPIWKEDK